MRGSGTGRSAGETQESPTVLDLFCGGSGAGEGLRQAGFCIVAATDCWAAAEKTSALVEHQDSSMAG